MILDYRQIIIDKLVEYAKQDSILPYYFTIDDLIDANNETSQSIRPSYLQSEIYPCIEVELGDNRELSRNFAKDEAQKSLMFNIRCIIAENGSLNDENGNIISAMKSVEYIADFVETTIATNFKFRLSARTSVAKTDDKLYVFLRYTATHNKITNKIY